MALTSTQLDECLSIAHKKINDEVASGFSKSNAFFNTMSKAPHRTYSDGGTSITIPIEAFEAESTGFIDGKFSTIPVTANQLLTHCSFDFKHYVSTTTFSLDEIARGSGKLAVIQLIEKKIALTKQKAIRDLSSALHTLSSSDPNQINSLKDAAADAAYGGISPTDVPSWAFNRDTSSNTINYATINGKFQELVGLGQSVGDQTGTYMPDMIISSSYTMGKFLDSQQSQQQFGTEASLRSGFQSILMNGINWFSDNFVAGSKDGATSDNELYILSTNTVRLFYRYGWEKKSPLDVLNMRLPNQAAASSQNYMTMNLCNISRRNNAVFTALT